VADLVSDEAGDASLVDGDAASVVELLVLDVKAASGRSRRQAVRSSTRSEPVALTSRNRPERRAGR
jgi:hypothetical protein